MIISNLLIICLSKTGPINQKYNIEKKGSPCFCFTLVLGQPQFILRLVVWGFLLLHSMVLVDTPGFRSLGFPRFGIKVYYCYIWVRALLFHEDLNERLYFIHSILSSNVFTRNGHGKIFFSIHSFSLEQ